MTNYVAAISEKGFYHIIKNHPSIKFIPIYSGWGSEEEIIFSRAVAKFHHLIILQE
jgi:hypothetical protein